MYLGNRIDKLISSFGTTIIGLFVALIGFTHAMPQVTDSLTPELFFVTKILYNGMPIAGWIISVIAMKFYPLTGKKMIEIEDQIAKLQLKQTKE